MKTIVLITFMTLFVCSSSLGLTVFLLGMRYLELRILQQP